MSGWSQAWRFIGIGWYIGLCIGLGVWVGVWADGKLETKPLFTVLGLACGLIAAFFGAYRLVLGLIKGDTARN